MEELQKSQTKHVLEVQRKNATQGHAAVELGLGKLCFAWLVTSHGSAWLPSEGLLWAHHHLVSSYWDLPSGPQPSWHKIQGLSSSDSCRLLGEQI